MDKDNILKRLREDQHYAELLGKAKDAEERDKIRAYTEGFVSSFYDSVFSHIQEAISKDPDALKKTLAELESQLIREETRKEGHR